MREDAYLHNINRCNGRVFSANSINSKGPDNTYALYQRKNDVRLRCKPIMFDPDRPLDQGSKKARYEKIICDFSWLRELIREMKYPQIETTCSAVFFYI